MSTAVIEMIVWDDAFSEDGWISLNGVNSIDEEKVQRFISTGVCIRETDRNIYLASSWRPQACDYDEGYGNIMVIPKGMVVSRVKIKDLR